MTKTNTTAPIQHSGLIALLDPLTNKGTAFSHEERDALFLRGLLPPHVETLDQQLERARAMIDEVDAPIEKYLRLRGFQDDNEVLFYSLVADDLPGTLPLIYTPTVGEGCEEFSHHYQHPRGLFLTIPEQDKIPQILANPRFDDIEVIVVSDGERILGLGDQGANGMGIPIGKLSLYTGCGGVDPAKTLPILLDTGTDNEKRRNSPDYIGWRHERVRGDEYDAFLDAFVDAVKNRWDHVLLQFEDFAQANALRLLNRYRDQLCTFNDDVQGTAAVAAGMLLAASKAAGKMLSDQTFVIFGAGSAGCGIGRMLVRLMVDEGMDEGHAYARFYAIDANGLLTQSSKLQDFQKPFARSADDIDGWEISGDTIDLQTVVENAGATVLIGTSGQGGAFTEDAIKAMAKHTERPIILPLSNPTIKSEAAPQDVLDWTEGKALVATGTPFDPVTLDGKQYHVDQANNAYIFPGVGLGAVTVRAAKVTDAMFVAAARRLAETQSPSADGPGHFIPPQQKLRDVAQEIAMAVAKQAFADGVAQIDEPDDDALRQLIRDRMWTPKYMSL
nr:NAD-dependent malic enzyme [uncultured Hyphomonas sp.]